MCPSCLAALGLVLAGAASSSLLTVLARTVRRAPARTGAGPSTSGQVDGAP
jgi:hypothetical protein